MKRKLEKNTDHQPSKRRKLFHPSQSKIDGKKDDGKRCFIDLTLEEEDADNNNNKMNQKQSETNLDSIGEEKKNDINNEDINSNSLMNNDDNNNTGSRTTAQEFLCKLFDFHSNKDDQLSKMHFEENEIAFALSTPHNYYVEIRPKDVIELIGKPLKYHFDYKHPGPSFYDQKVLLVVESKSYGEYLWRQFYKNYVKGGYHLRIWSRSNGCGDIFREEFETASFIFATQGRLNNETRDPSKLSSLTKNLKCVMWINYTKLKPQWGYNELQERLVEPEKWSNITINII